MIVIVPQRVELHVNVNRKMKLISINLKLLTYEGHSEYKTAVHLLKAAEA